MTKPELFDTAELLVDLPECNLRAGALGAIVHQHSDDMYEVEFVDEDGQTRAVCALSTQQFMIVWRHATQSWVPVLEQMAELVSRLREPARREVLDFARFLHARSAQEQASRKEPAEKEVVR